MAGKRIGASRQEAATAIGISRQQLWEHERAGRVVLYPDRSVDIQATAVRIETMKDHRGGKPIADLPAGARPRAPAAPADPPSEPPPDVPAELLSLPPMEVERRRKLAVMLKAETDAETAKVELAQLRGELLSRADTEALWVEIITRAKSQIEALPVRVAPRLLGLKTESDIRAVLRAEVENLLRGLRDDTPLPE